MRPLLSLALLAGVVILNLELELPGFLRFTNLFINRF